MILCKMSKNKWSDVIECGKVEQYPETAKKQFTE